METVSLKALANKVLRGNRQGNFTETLSFHEGNFKETPEGTGKLCNDMVTLPPIEASTPPAPDNDLFNIPVNTWLEKLSDSERDTYNERAAIMEYDGGLPREQAEVEAIKRIIRERVIPGKCDKCERVSGCMMTKVQRGLCEVVRP